MATAAAVGVYAGHCLGGGAPSRPRSRQNGRRSPPTAGAAPTAGHSDEPGSAREASPDVLSARAAGDAFHTVPDYSNVNFGIHQSRQIDSFNMPGGLSFIGQKTMGSKQHGRDHVPWGMGDMRDLLAFVEQGFLSSLRTVGVEIVKDIRQTWLEPFRIELQESFVTLDDKIRQVQVDAETMLEPIREEYRKCDEMRMEKTQESLGRLEGRLNDDFHSFREQLRALSEGQEETKINLQEVCRELKANEAQEYQKVEANLRQDLERLAQKLDQSDEELQALHRDFSSSREETVPAIEKQVSVLLDRQHEATDKRLKGVLSQMLKAMELVQSDFAQIHSEVGRIQQTLQMDFADGLAKIHVSVMEEVRRQSVVASSSFAQEPIETQPIETQPSGTAFATKNRRTWESLCSKEETAVVKTSSAKSQQSLSDEEPSVPTGQIRSDLAAQGLKSSEKGSGDAVALQSRGTMISGQAAIQDYSARMNMKGRKSRVVRMRHCGVNTDTTGLKDAGTQTKLTGKTRAGDYAPTAASNRPRGVTKEMSDKDKSYTGIRNKEVFADADAMKAQVRSALTRPQYNVCDCYYETGCCQAIAKSWIFENLTHVAILANAVWIGLDTDLNDGTTLLDAPLVFQIGEMLFCAFFTGELAVRFGAFQHKADCLRDRWFVFDSVLVIFMVFETWLLTLVILAMGDDGSLEFGDASIIRILKMVKLLRISRMARLLKALPEVMVLFKGLFIAGRAVFAFLLTWLLLIYVFSVIIRHVNDRSPLILQNGDRYFKSVPDTMNTLLLGGLLPGPGELVMAIGVESSECWVIGVLFIFLAALTLMYMLIGVMVEVIGVISATEREGSLVVEVANTLRQGIYSIGSDPDQELDQKTFLKLFTNADVGQMLEATGVDLFVLLDMADLIFEDNASGLNFEKLVDVVMSMRGRNPVTVKDIKAQQRFLKKLITETNTVILTKVEEELASIKEDIASLKEPAEDSEEEADEAQDMASSAKDAVIDSQLRPTPGGMVSVEEPLPGLFPEEDQID